MSKLKMSDVVALLGDLPTMPGIAIKILEGSKPSEIPIIANRRWNIYANTALLKKAGISGKTELLSTEARLLLATGFCGGFTTLSSFIYELGQYVQDKEFFFASSYFVATLAGAAIAFVLGLIISGILLR